MNPSLHLRMHIDPHLITITAAGQLTAHTAHLLPKVVIGTLRRYGIASMHLNLSAVTTIDYVGVTAIEDCEFETARRGVALIISSPRPGHWPAPGAPAVARHAKRLRPMVSTGTICRQRSNMR